MTDDGTNREEFVSDPVDHVRTWAGMSVGDLATEYGNAGIGAADLHDAIEITTTMFSRDDVTTFVGVAGAMVPGGMRRILADLIRDGHIDALVTTGATLTHDSIEAIGGHHHHGRSGNPEKSPKAHDETLRDEGVDRIYNIYLPQEQFTAFEEHLRTQVFPNLDRTVSIQELTSALGRANVAVNAEAEIDADPGVTAAAAKHDVPIFCPAVADSILGIQAWMRSRISEFDLDALADMTMLNDLATRADRTGALVVGGGVPKNYVLQTMLVTPDAYDYAVQLTTEPDHTGGLSGAPLDEARSWGKLAKTAQNATVVGDATITFPFLIAAVRDRLSD